MEITRDRAGRVDNCPVSRPMFQFTRVRRSSAGPALALVGLIAAAILVVAEASAHHPGSHAERAPGGRVKLIVSALVPDGCTTIGGVAVGAPQGIEAPEGTIPVTARYRRTGAAACTQALRNVTAEALLEVPAGDEVVHLYVLGADGRLVNSERVRIRN